MQATLKPQDIFIQQAHGCCIVETDQELIDWLISINTRNRAVKPSVVNTYKNEMESGQWELTSQGIGISKSGVLLDGQHRVLANRAAGYPKIPMLIVYGLEDKAQLKVDTHAKRRTADILALALNISANQTLASALKILCNIKAGRPGARIFTEKASIEALCDTYEDFQDYISQVGVSKNVGETGPFWACVLLAMASGAPLASIEEFVRGYRTGENLSPNSPVLKLRDKRTQVSMAGGRGQEGWFCMTSRCLAAFLKGEKLSKLYPPELSVAIASIKDCEK